VLSELAVFWTAVNIEEKKVVVGLLPDAGGFSGMGVSGAVVIVDSLLGPALDPALRR
jgi:hypothetical protein